MEKAFKELQDYLKDISHKLDTVLDKIDGKKKTKVNQDTQDNVLIWNEYKQRYFDRYGVEPVRNASVNGQVANLRKKLGIQDAIKVVAFYLHHNDSYYLKQTHSLSLCLKDAETLRTQMLRGKPITTTMIRNFEKSQQTRDLIERIDKDGI